MTSDTSIRARSQAAGGTQVIQTACPMVAACLGGCCPIYAHVKDGTVVKFEPVIPGRFCGKGAAWPERIHSPERLTYPMKRTGARGEGKWQRVSWDEALDTIVQRLRDIRSNYGEQAFVVFDMAAGLAGERFGQLLGGTSISFIGAVGDSPVGSARATGWRNWSDPLGRNGGQQAPGGHAHEDLAMHSNLILFWGYNVAESEQLQMKHFIRAQERGAKLITIDPLFSTTAALSDQWVPVKVGTDAALALAMIAVIHTEEGLADWAYMRQHTNGPFLVRADNGQLLRESDVRRAGDPNVFMVWDEISGRVQPAGAPDVRASLMGSHEVNGIRCTTAYQLLIDEAQRYTPERTAEITGVPAKAIRQLALDYATTKPAAIKKGWGLLRTYHAHHAERLVLTLAALTGNLGVPGGGVTAISSFQAPQLNRQVLPPLANPAPSRLLDSLTFLRAAAGEDVPELGGKYPIKGMLWGGMNWVNQWPGQTKTLKKIIPNLEFIAVAELVMSDSANVADIVLPVVTPYEHEGVCLPGYYGNLIQYMPQLIDPVGECKSDFEIFKELGIRMGWGQHFRDLDEAALLPKLWETVPGVTFDRIKREKMLVWEGFNPGDTPEHPHVEFRDAKFRTPSGRLEFYAEECADLGDALPAYKERPREIYDPTKNKYPLSLVSYHSKFLANGTLNETRHFRELAPEPYVAIAPVDAEQRSIADNDLVDVFNDLGSVRLRAHFSQGARPGVVSIMQGWRRNRFVQGAMQELLSSDINPSHVKMVPLTGADPNAALHDVWVDVRRAG